ncbi:MAG: hypothetical protein ACLQO7_13885 [Candidatus Bathyarchaeia archaeon]
MRSSQKDSQALARFACIGDSITQTTQYPSDVQALLSKIYNG